MERRRSRSSRRLAARGGRRQGDYAGRALVLIVDDHVDSRDLLATVLQETGVAIAEAGTGREALARAFGEPRPDLILLDLALPDRHGADVARALKADLRTRHIPIVALSASVRPGDRDTATLAGCAGFVAKPLLPDAVVDLVRRLLSGTSP